MGETTGPFAEAHERYWRAGWRGVLPVGRGPAQKHPVPPDYTGYRGRWPSYADVQAWADGIEGERNIGLRLPEDVIGLDVDAYGARVGAASLAGLVERYGPLPPTWVTSARDDGASGIKLYRVPPGLHWPGEAGPNIEIIQTGHRYAIVWPSVNPEAGGARYEWWIEDEFGVRSTAESILGRTEEMPAPADLPELPATWVQGLTLPYDRAERAELGHAAASAWYGSLRAASPLEGPCRVITAAALPALDVIEGRVRGGRHETTLAAVRAIVAYGGEGHAGAAQACTYIGERFLAVLGAEPGRDAVGEWARLLLGAVELAARAYPTPRQRCECGLWAGQGVMFDPPAAPAAASTVVGAEMWNQVEPVSGWAAQDVEALLDGTYVPEEPALLVREDGHWLLYRGRVHSFHGESESGKSMLAQHAAAEVLRAGGTAVYVDFESDAHTVIPRLLAMSVPAAAIRERLAYIRPSASGWGDPAFVQLLTEPRDLAVIDGVTESMALMGVERSTDNDQITKWSRAFPRALATRSGAAVVLVDHVTKSEDGRGRHALGGVAKMNMLDGAAYTIEVREPLGVGMKGSITVRVGKDRPGQVRPHSGAFRARDRTQETAYVVVDSTVAGEIRIRLWPPRADKDEQSELMQAVSMYLEGWKTDLGAPLGRSMRNIRENVKGRNTDIQAACTRLADEGFIAIEVKGNGHLHTLVRPFRVPVTSAEGDLPDVTFDPGS
jgi:hypothetical protein